MSENVNVTILSADAFLRAPAIDTSLALTVVGYSDGVKAKLMHLYGEVEVVADGKPVRLSELTSAKRIAVAAQDNFNKQRYNAVDAERVIARLMQKPGGCPWDSVQTHESIRINMVEEAYEAVDAIDKHDIDNMIEEFGDVYLQSLLQSAIAKRDGEFDFDDVCDGLCKKLISRHSFIFGDEHAGSADDAITLWDRNKATEKHYTSVKDQLSKLPETFPALLYAQKVHKKTKKAGVSVDAQADLKAALAAGEYAAAIVALSGVLADEGKDAEVEVNALIKKRIADL